MIGLYTCISVNIMVYIVCCSNMYIWFSIYDLIRGMLSSSTKKTEKTDNIIQFIICIYTMLLQGPYIHYSMQGQMLSRLDTATDLLGKSHGRIV